MQGFMKQFWNIHVGLSIVTSTFFSRPDVAGAALQTGLWFRHLSIDWLIQSPSFSPLLYAAAQPEWLEIVNPVIMEIRAFADIKYGEEDSISHSALNFPVTKG